MKANEYIEEFEAIEAALKEKKKRTPNQYIEIAKHIQGEMGKDRRKPFSTSDHAPATEKQLNLLRTKGYANLDGLSKSEASKLIDEALAKA